MDPSMMPDRDRIRVRRVFTSGVGCRTSFDEVRKDLPRRDLLDRVERWPIGRTWQTAITGAISCLIVR